MDDGASHRPCDAPVYVVHCQEHLWSSGVCRPRSWAHVMLRCTSSTVISSCDASVYVVHGQEPLWHSCILTYKAHACHMNGTCTAHDRHMHLTPKYYSPQFLSHNSENADTKTTKRWILCLVHSPYHTLCVQHWIIFFCYCRMSILFMMINKIVIICYCQNESIK